MPITPVDAITLRRWMKSGEAALVDVREPAEHAAERIEGALLLPVDAVQCSALPDCTGRRLVLHCRSGKRSAAACEKLLSEDPTREIYNLDGGITAWAAAGQPLTVSGRFFLPLDRQVQLTVGLLLVMASLMGYFSTPGWFLLTGLIGTGLAFAGATGFCGLARLLARMPWNQRTAAGDCCG